jgi:hypothetical protein
MCLQKRIPWGLKGSFRGENVKPNIDGFAKIRTPVKTGVQITHDDLKELHSGFRRRCPGAI